LLDITVGYGYRPWRTGLWGLAAIFALTAVFWLWRDSVSFGSDARPQQRFTPASAFYLAADTFIPVGDFGVADNWVTVGWLEGVRLIFVALGWALISIFAVGVTRVVRS
jgi:hypothetical protein